VSFLDEEGRPGIVERALIVPPRGQIGPITPEQRKEMMKKSIVAGVYEEPVDRESAYEKLKAKTETASKNAEEKEKAKPAAEKKSSGGGRGRRSDTVVEAAIKSAARSMASTAGRQIVRGILGSIFGGRR